ncbi:MAG: glycosyltransferase family 9 protein [Chitinophagaceae bacterium]|nr:glycosyltransferase family 9 protein [Oligoflexus sp.]
MKKVLLVSFDNLGDLVFASAVARSLASDPDIHLGLLCKDYTAKLGYLLPGVKQVFAADPFWDRSPNRKKGKIANFFRCLSSVRQQHFDEAIILSKTWETALAIRLAGVRNIYAWKGKKNGALVTKSFPFPSDKRPVVAGFIDSFAPILPIKVDPHTELLKSSFPSYERPRVLHGKKLVVLHAFAGRVDRCAPLVLWGEIAVALTEAGYHVLWTGIPLETQRIRYAFPAVWDASHFVDTWAQDLLQLAWIWSEAELFIGHDSGPLHVAHALNVPVLGLYLPGEPKRTFPQALAPWIMISKTSPAELTAKEVIDKSFQLLKTTAAGEVVYEQS